MAGKRKSRTSSFGSIGKTAANLLTGKRWRSDVLTEKFSGKAIGESLEEFRESIGMGDAKIPANGVFKSYVESRLRTINGFAAIKSPDVVAKLSANTPEATAAKAAIHEALTLQERTSAAEETFRRNIAALMKRMDDPTRSFNPGDVTSFLQEVKNAGHKAIEEQQKSERDRLTAKFDDPAFKAALMTSLELTDDEQYTKVKTDMLKELKSSHEKELQKFDKRLEKPIQQLHKAANNPDSAECARVALLANLDRHSSTMRKEIDKLYEKNRKATGSRATVEILGEPNRARYKGISINDLDVIESIVGVTLQNNKDGSFTAQLPHHFFLFRPFDPMFYASSQHRSKVVFLTIAQSVRASGYDTIEMTINNGADKEIALEQAREAYEACIELGFAPEDITIMVNGKKKSPAELGVSTSSTQSRLNAEDRKSAQASISNKATQDEFKREVSAYHAPELPEVEEVAEEEEEEKEEKKAKPGKK